MNSGIQITVDTRKAMAQLQSVGLGMNPNTYLSLIGQRLLSWVNKNFKDQGTEKPWKPLSPNTLIARRMMGKGSKILRDTGRMAQSFTFWYQADAGANEVRVLVGTEDQKAEWHEKGTAPYTIQPKGSGYLKFPVAVSGGRGFVSTKQVNHPGLPSRPMLPTENTGRNLAEVTLQAYVEKVIAKANEAGK